jgi:hypothetical protein
MRISLGALQPADASRATAAPAPGQARAGPPAGASLLSRRGMPGPQHLPARPGDDRALHCWSLKR